MGYVYFIGAAQSGAIKIGFTTGNPLRRLAALQTANCEDLVLLAVVDGSPQLEGEMHRRFAQNNVRGEWFDPTGALGEFVRNLRHGEPRPESRFAGSPDPNREALIAECPWWNTNELADGVPQ